MPSWNIFSSSSSKNRKHHSEDPREEKLPTADREKTLKKQSCSDSNKNEKIIEIDHLPVMEQQVGKRKLKLVHMSDSHQFHEHLKNFPEGDIFIHSAIFLIRVKIVIFGNHDIGFNGISPEFVQNNVLTNAIYLQDQSVIIKYKGKQLLKIYGTPWTSSRNMGFSMNRKDIEQKWNDIPNDIDVLVTHLPPFGIMDLASGTEPQHYCDYCKKNHCYKRHWGNEALRKRSIQLNEQAKLKAHLFGHVHEYHGLELEKQSNATVPLIYSNGASVANHNDNDVRDLNVIELDLGNE
ncbi:hypothetical protein C9374_004029 [Naegleria lovaniensis]|uniref:Calcineurin-like phosphoesterase domain-containing protein n=1 Tax=Naegleria lovaniensis TaxID=51637 RepID=A0AA88H0B8_NAELO|nr:uncharacterized protein C9374_004029 [Naegleria lovaniensis]KAG2394265.1 hypothetical protein C9374_004029 [Naegleria lovaniensis]